MIIEDKSREAMEINKAKEVLEETILNGVKLQTMGAFYNSLRTAISCMDRLEGVEKERDSLFIDNHALKSVVESSGKDVVLLRLFLHNTREDVRKLEKELKWWHNLISKHHDNDTCPNLKTYVENLQKEIVELKSNIK